MATDDEESDCDQQWEAGYYECEIEWGKANPHPRMRDCKTIHECAAMYVSEACGGTGMTALRHRNLP